jgi:hypothetical protein
MKELITEEQAGQIVFGLCLLITLASLAYGAYQSKKAPKNEKKGIWANAILFAVLGPVTWGFWLVYNSIENYYGLDSLKALKINFLIVLGIAALFVVLHQFLPRFIQVTPAPKRRK